MELTTLRELGLSEGQIRVYQAVLELGISSLNGIQEKTGIERRNIYDILNKLIERGFVTYTIEKGRKTYQCTHPNTLGEKITQKRAALAKLEQQLPQITDLFNFSKPHIRAEVYRGNESLKAFLDEALEHEESFWIGGNSGIEQKTGDEMKRWFRHWNNRRIETNHVMHDLVDHGTWLEDYPPENVAKHKRELYKYCELPPDLQSPMVMIMFGNKVAQVLWSKQSFAFVLEAEEIRESFMKYFHYFWRDPW